ncbi:hypothetical protein VNO77_18735 [Canavalia gladiata]|uniref:Uncharacterized protein n=1 Tax=Canavalia gladiata TaxID=3824 RepID=A0AAN9QHY5_CANGL
MEQSSQPLPSLGSNTQPSTTNVGGNEVALDPSATEAAGGVYAFSVAPLSPWLGVDDRGTDGDSMCGDCVAMGARERFG